MVKNLKYYAAVGAAVAVAIALIALTANQNLAEMQTKPVPNADAQVQVDAMTEIAGQIEANLSLSTVDPAVQHENINQAEHLVFGKPVILDTNGVPDTLLISNDYDAMVAQIKGALLQCSLGSCGDGTVAADAKELADRITYWQEIKENLEVQTNDPICDVNNPASCQQLWRGDEPQATGPGISVGVDRIWDGFYREIRSPYYPIVGYPAGLVQEENIIPTGPIANGECSTVIKEIHGIKAIQRPVQIPIWQEPWTSRATIIGFTTVWVVDFVPAEFVKNLNFCNAGGVVTFDYDINVIIERELTHFWQYLPKGHP